MHVILVVDAEQKSQQHLQKKLNLQKSQQRNNLLGAFKRTLFCGGRQLYNRGEVNGTL